jgi:MFS transporter, DHA1 family, inner membrane transport protein
LIGYGLSSTGISDMTQQQKVILYLLACVNFTHILDFMIMMPMGPMLIDYFKISQREFNILVSSYSIMACITSLVASAFVDRYDRKKVLSYAYIGFVVGTLACAIAPTYGLLMAARVLAGFFGGVLPGQVLSIVGDSVSYDHRAEAMSYTMMAFSLASAIGVPLGLSLAVNFSWHIPFVVVGLLGFVNMALLYRFMPPITKHLQNQQPVNVWAVYKGVFTDSNLTIALAVSAIIMFGHFSTIPALSTYLERNAHMDRQNLFLIYLFGGLATVFSARMIGRLADKYGKYRVYVITGVLSLIPVYLMTNLPPVPLWAILVVSVMFFIFANSRMITQQAIVSSVVTPEKRGGFMSINSSVQSMASGVGSLVAGFIISENTTTGELLHYNWVGFMSMAFLILGVWLAKKLVKVD